MANKYGPWATLIDVGGNPQLSAFWKRRLTMLVPASRTSPILSRRHLLLLAAVGILACILPTVFFTPATAQEKKPTQENDTLTKPGVSIVTFSGPPGGDHIYIPVYISFNLSSEANRKRLNITDEQATKLREISTNYENLMKSMRNEMKKSAPTEQAAKQRENQAKLEDARKAIRKQIEEFLSPEQLAAMRKEGLGLQAGVIIAYPRLQERIGLTDEQKKQLSALLNSTEQKAINDRFVSLVEENSKKMLAVITPQQWDELQRIAGDSSEGYYAFAVSGMSAWSFPGTEIEELQYPETFQKLNISAQQQAKLKDIIAQSERQSAELGQLAEQSQSPTPTARQRAQEAEMSQKIDEFQKLNHQQIVETLTPQQMSELRKICVQGAFLGSLADSGILGRRLDAKDQEGILSRIKASREQIAQLQSLEDEINSLQRRNFSTLGEQVLAILTAKQQENIFDVLDDPNKFEDSGKTKSTANDGGGNGAAKSASGTMTIDGGTLVIGAAGNAEKPADAKPANEKSQAEAKSGGKTAGGNFSGGTIVLSGATSSKDGRIETISSSLPLNADEAGDEIDYPEFDSDFAFTFYLPLTHDRYRKELGLTDEQENKLREISQNHRAEMDRQRKDPAHQAKLKEIDILPEQEQMAKINKIMKEEIKPVRKQVDDTLNAQQLASLKNIVLSTGADICWRLTEPLTKVFGMTEQQQHAFYENLSKLNMETYAKTRELQQANDNKRLSVLNPTQREELERQAGKSDFVQSAYFEKMGFIFTPSTGVAEAQLHDLSEPDVSKALEITPEQWTKINAILKSQPVQDLYKLWGPKFDKANGTVSANNGNMDDLKRKNPELLRKTDELKKQLRQQIETVFTPKQAETFKKVALRKAVLKLLRNPQILKDIKVTDQQIAELSRLREERAWISLQQSREEGKIILYKLSPQQREKLVAELDRQEWLYH
jgi:hypothetical protein